MLMKCREGWTYSVPADNPRRQFALSVSENDGHLNLLRAIGFI
jgi:hypothetical protein